MGWQFWADIGVGCAIGIGLALFVLYQLRNHW